MLKLTAGEKAVLPDGAKTALVSMNTDPNYLAWKTNELIFNDTPLTGVQKFERSF